MQVYVNKKLVFHERGPNQSASDLPVLKASFVKVFQRTFMESIRTELFDKLDRH